jgi:putative glutamine amidotransferase
MSKPLLIGVSARIYHPGGAVLDLGGVWSKTLHYLEQSVAHWVMSRDVLALMIPAVDRESLVKRSDISLHAYAHSLDGLVLQGGNDIAPESYGESPLAPEWAGDRVRDRYEIELLNAFVEAGKPVIGICRGCQLINVAFGGTLYQDIQTQVGGSLLHRCDKRYEDNFHALRLVEGGLLSRLYPREPISRINTIHHQAVKALGRDLVIEAVSEPDGIVEAVRWDGPSYVAGVQWHPEFMDPADTELLDGKPLLRSFIDACRRRKESGKPSPALESVPCATP